MAHEAPTNPMRREASPLPAPPLWAPTLQWLLQTTGARGGWVVGALGDAPCQVLATQGEVPDQWLSLALGELQLPAAPTLWGIDLHAGPALLNELRSPPSLGIPSPTHLLSCPFRIPGETVGHVALVDKRNGFTSHDAFVLQSAVQLVTQLVGALPPTYPGSLGEQILNQLPIGVFVVDAHGRIVFVNDRWASWTGFHRDELLGRVPPYPFWLTHRALFAGGPHVRSMLPSAEGPWPFRHRDNRPFWCSMETKSWRFDGAEFRAAYLSSPQYQPGLEPGASRAMDAVVHGLLSELPASTALLNAQGTIVWCNANMVQALGSHEPILGTSLARYLGLASQAALAEFLSASPTVGAHRGRRLPLQIAGDDGSPRWLLSLLLRFNGHVLVTCIDEWSELLVPQDALAGQRLAPPRDALVFGFQRDGVIDLWDQRWEELTGLSATDVGELNVETFFDWLLPRQADRDAIADWLHMPQRDAQHATVEILTRHGPRRLQTHFFPLNDRGRERWIVFAHEPVVAPEPGAWPFRILAGGLTRLLNSYFSVPVGLSEMALDRDDLPGDVSNYFQKILESSQRASRLLTSLNDLATISLSDVQTLSLAQIVRDLLSERNGEAECEVHADLQADGDWVRANPRMLQTAFRHLLQNAVHAVTFGAHKRLEVCVRGGKEGVSCEIRDTGEGIATEDLPQLFVPFFSTKGPFARDGRHAAIDAAGLGLPVARQYITLHGGSLDIQSEPGKGTQVRVWLPAAESAPGSAPFTKSHLSPVVGETVSRDA